MNDIVRILLIWLLCLLCVLLHELGHALGYRISGGKAGWKVIAGSGPRMIRMRKCTFCPIPVGGYFNPGEEPGTNRGKVIMYAGGPFVSVLLAALFGVLRFCVFGSVQPEDRLGEILLPVSNFLMFFNFFQFLFTAVPVRYRLVCRGLESDGMQIVHVLKHSKRQDPHES